MKKKYLPIDYVNVMKDISFTASPFNEVDSTPFILFLLQDIDHIGIPREGESGYITFENAIKNQHQLHGGRKLGLLLPKNINDLLDACAESNRFKDSKFYNLHNVVDDKTQSSFVMCDITEKTTLVIFGGTDDSVIGWVEDFNLLLSHDVGCLSNAREYVNRNCREDKTYILCGHSKGGMTTCYCFFTVDKEIQNKIAVAYDMDGPGFDQDFLMEHMDCPSIDKLRLVCPKDSFVGRLFFQPIPATVCKTIDKGINQHNPTGWVVDGNKFAREKHYGKSGTINAIMAYGFINTLTDEEKRDAISALTKIVMNGEAKTLSQLILKPFKMIKAYTKLSKPEKKIMRKVPGILIKNKFRARKTTEKRKQRILKSKRKNKNKDNM